MVKFRLAVLLAEREMTRVQLARLTEIRPNTISNLCNNRAESIKLVHLERICETLNCTFDDLMICVPQPKMSDQKHGL